MAGGLVPVSPSCMLALQQTVAAVCAKNALLALLRLNKLAHTGSQNVLFEPPEM